MGRLLERFAQNIMYELVFISVSFKLLFTKPTKCYYYSYLKKLLFNNFDCFRDPMTAITTHVTFNDQQQVHSINDKPAFIMYDHEGDVYREEYLYNNERHRDGLKPAYLIYNKLGEITEEVYYIHGEIITEKEINRLKTIEKRKNILKECRANKNH